jgi:diadenosine tetraphosphate (Ap4A) HIT family hydrolase
VIDRQPFDLDAYIHRIQNSPCFICEMLEGRLNGNVVIDRNETCIVWLNKYPSLYGYVLVAPVEHREQVTGDFSLEDYLRLQCEVYAVAEAVRRSVPTERVYILSLGSQKGNAHVHWHIAPLPPGVPFKEQQLEALRAEAGILALSEEEMQTLAAQIRQKLTQVRSELSG